MASPSVGFVYILTNPLFPDMVKVGFTTRIVEDRVSELATAVPTEFEVVYRATTMNPREVERETHEMLGPLRVGSGKEFFYTDVASARETIAEAAQYVTGLHVWAEWMMAQGRLCPLDAQTRNVLPLEAGQWFIWFRYFDSADLLMGRPQVVDIWQVHSDGDSLEIIGSRTRQHLAGFTDMDPGGEEDPISYLDRAQAAPNGHIIGRERLVPGDRLQWISNPGDFSACLSVVFEARSYCQVIGRTWDPKYEDGWPLLLTFLTTDELAQPVADRARAGLRLSPPRVWAPADGHPAAEDFGTQERSPQQWLNALLGREEG